MNDLEFIGVGHSNGNTADFEFAAVRPVKKIFVSRLPPDINIDVLKRHVLRRVPSCGNDLVIAILNGKTKNKYSSALISVGQNDDFFRMINSQSFWPSEIIVHQHRTIKPNNNYGFRSNKGNNWRRH